ncbi:lipase family protein [Janibacter sp. Y6]|uniref:lipase family protein n=1 Tax=Janibacter sp. Y6 TaxID=2913552 RepID=UPI0034A21A50
MSPTPDRPARTRVLLAALLAVALLAGAAGWWVARDDGSAADVATGLSGAPAGADFYRAGAQEIRDGEHGSLIWSREETGTGLEGARTHLVLYRSVGAKGEPVAVSGTVTLPPGEPPEGGWPVISWGHGTTGTADTCAPSLTTLQGQARFYTSLTQRVLDTYLQRGYVVVASDYEGLGTPGPHPYLLGESAGRAMTDIVSAARELDDQVSGTWLAAGHSQGGQAALFTAQSVDGYAPDLDLQGIAAIAPPSQLRRALTTSIRDDLDRSTFLGPLLSSAAAVAGVPRDRVFSARGVALLPQLEDRCLEGLSAQDSFGGVRTGDLVRPGVDLTPVERVVADNDASALTPEVPVLVVQGTADTTVPVILTDALARQWRADDVDLTYRRVAGKGHVDVLEDARTSVDRWLEQTAPALP